MQAAEDACLDVRDRWPQAPSDASAKAHADFLSFVQGHQDKALRLALRLLAGDRATAEDLVQDAFVRAQKGLAHYRGEASLATWFDRILVREVYRYFRKPWRRWLSSRSAEDESHVATPALPDPALRKRIEAALARLSFQQRAVFVLVHLEGHSIEETAHLMNRAPGTIKSHLHRALQTLRQELADLSPHSGNNA